MSTLDAILDAQACLERRREQDERSRRGGAVQLSIDDLLAVLGQEEAGDASDGNDLKRGALVTHRQYPDFRGRVVAMDNGKSKVEVVDGWRGAHVPRWPVTIPTSKLVEVE